MLWRKRKVAHPTVTKLTEKMSFDDWLAELKVALVTEDVEGALFPNEGWGK